MTNPQLTSSLEDYLEVISNHLKENPKIRAIDISRELNVSRASVSEALKRLAEKGLINYGRYDVITLTEQGALTAQGVINKHKLLHEFFKDILGLDEAEAAENACKIEHVISENVHKRLMEFVKFNREMPSFSKQFLDSIRK